MRKKLLSSKNFLIAVQSEVSKTVPSMRWALIKYINKLRVLTLRFYTLI